MDKKYFSRERKQSFSGTILFLLNFLTKSVPLEILNFVKYISQYKPEQNNFTQSAFVQARNKIKPEVFVHLNEVLVDEFYTENDSLKKWNNKFRLLAVDGSNFNLPKTKELEQIYGTITNTNVVQAKVSVLYDVFNKIAINTIVSPLSANERSQAIELIKDCKQDDLLLYDRGYPSFDFIHTHIESNLDYVMRVKVELNNQVKNFIASGKESVITEFSPNHRIDLTEKPYDKDTKIKVRLVRVDLGNENVEVLITSLLDEQEFKNDIFKELYFHRWKIETYYNELKTKMRVEIFSGHSNISVLQDIYSTILVSNIQSIIIQEINDELPQDRQYEYKINTSLSYAFMKDKVISLLFSKQSMKRTKKELKILFLQNTIPIRPGRSMPRDLEKSRLRRNNKSPKNQKINI